MNLRWLLFSLVFLIPAEAAELRGARLFKSGPIQITANGQDVWSVNPDNDSVTWLQTSTEVVTEIPLPGGQKHAPKGISVKEDGSEVLVACHDSDRIYVINGTNGAIVKQIDLPWGSGPFSVAIAPDQTKALVTLHRAEGLAVLDLSRHEVAQIIPQIFWGPMGIAWAEEGKAAWINHIFAPGEHPLQTRVEFVGMTGRVTTSMQITPADPRNSVNLTAPYNIPEGGYLNIRGHSAQIPRASGRNELWMPTQYHNMGTDAYTPDSTMQSVIRHIDLTSRKFLTELKDKLIITAKYVHNPTSGGTYLGPGWDAHAAGPIDLGFSLDGRTVYFLNELSRNLFIFPTSTPTLKPANGTTLPEVMVGDRPIGLAVSPNAAIAYVCNQLSRDISVVDLAQVRELKRIPSTPVTSEPFSASVLKGARIFHSSADPRISRNGKVSCASCHINAERDGRTWGFQALPGKHGPRKVPSLLGLNLTMGPKDAAYGWGQLHRSGDRDEIQDFEHTFQGVQMGGTGFLGSSVNPELGALNAGRSAELDAMADYVLSLPALKRSRYRNADGKLSEAAIRGATFFRGANRKTKRADANCASCHKPDKAFVDFTFHDVGQRHDGSEKELGARTPSWIVNTPTLVGVWAGAPYTGVVSFDESHTAFDSMVSLLKDAATRATANASHGTPDGLAGRQLRDLAEFVLSIDGNMTPEEVNGARDISPPRLSRVEPTSLSRIDVWFNEAVSEASVERAGVWRLMRNDGTEVPVTAAVFDPANGDHVTLTTGMRPHASYKLSVVGDIFDLADSASDGVANKLVITAPENNREFSIADRLTITLGASGYENLTVLVHDSAMVGPGLPTWDHDSVTLSPAAGNTPPMTTGFVRFGWQSLFQQVTGVNLPDQILHASFSLDPELGDASRIELRRVLQKWSDAATGGDWNDSATGAPTWRDSAHPTKRWNLAGAGKLGSSGAATNDYNGLNDLTEVIDMALIMSSMTEPAVFESSGITDAYRFWLKNPSVDFGHALRLGPATQPGVKFTRSENGLRSRGPVLRITYYIPGTAPKLEISAREEGILIEWPADSPSWFLEYSFLVNQMYTNISIMPGINGGKAQILRRHGLGNEYFRLIKP